MLLVASTRLVFSLVSASTAVSTPSGRLAYAIGTSFCLNVDVDAKVDAEADIKLDVDALNSELFHPY